MKVSMLVGERFKETPSECIIDSHILMTRGGYMKYVAGGIYSLLAPMRRITQKIERIIREEMDAIGGQEVLFPVVLPATLWEESGRYESIGSELVRFSDRHDNRLVLGMTHEEAAVHLVREYGNSYQKYPFMIYQIQTKFRDEARPRGGLIRVREFTMKDAYSFHISQEDLNVCYEIYHRAYERIYKRAGLKDVVSVASDSGMMGGSLSHEFMYLTPIGEDSIAICGQCGYSANVEAAKNIVENEPASAIKDLELVETPNVKTIDDLCGFLTVEPKQICKAVVYQKKSDNSYVVLFTRGDLEANETKLANHLGCEIYPAAIDEGSGLVAGFIGPYQLSAENTVLFDNALRGTANLICGGNKVGYHYKGLQIERDCGGQDYGDFCKIIDGGICPNCGKASISISRGIEVGNIFQLGDKYTKAMGMQYSDQNGDLHHPIMGCYGIGVGRLAASVCEACHDEYGPIWPISIAAWQVELCCVRADNAEVKTLADELYAKLTEAGVEVLYDDRTVSAGVMFADADLFGLPLRVICSPRNLAKGQVEIVSRDKKISESVEVLRVVKAVQDLVCECYDCAKQSS